VKVKQLPRASSDSTHAPSVRLDEPLDDRQAQTCPAVLTVRLLVSLEDDRLEVGRDANSRVGHLHLDVVIDRIGGERDAPTGLVELEGVCQVSSGQCTIGSA
jgi:hypothetical protein